MLFVILWQKNDLFDQEKKELCSNILLISTTGTIRKVRVQL